MSGHVAAGEALSEVRLTVPAVVEEQVRQRTASASALASAGELRPAVPQTVPAVLLLQVWERPALVSRHAAAVELLFVLTQAVPAAVEWQTWQRKGAASGHVSAVELPWTLLALLLGRHLASLLSQTWLQGPALRSRAGQALHDSAGCQGLA